ncbi:hypothetical protein P154DRAFT_560491 [Amniculicola lignicola CBS 123094]|uniref:Uncharacterized protein n=1 Tax=Amniculicola lignicola CBS 123094 TaxID=1392246 RepID=A0A6A5WSN4_9PLEO|nr:hypothetical protein P154DRAFT_560491 [Amniculicola lignicola CBS 123094]
MCKSLSRSRKCPNLIWYSLVPPGEQHFIKNQLTCFLNPIESSSQHKMSTRQPSDPKAPQAAWMNRADVKFPTDLCATVHWIVALQNKYEQVKTFVPVAPSALSKATSDAKVTVQKIQSVMKQATESLVELYQELDKKVKHVEVQTFKTEGWYKSALVLDELFQQREEFRAALNEIRNPEAYSSYLHTQFVKANKRELFSRGSLRSFMQASCEEIRRVQSMPGGRSFAFRLWIQLKMDLALPKGQAIGDTFLFGYRSIINNAINELIQRPFEDGAHLNFAWAARAVVNFHKSLST